MTSPHPVAVAAEVSNLTVVYDDRCALCRRCRRWVMSQPQLVPFRFVAASDPWVRQWLGGLVPVGDDLVVVDDGGRAWVGPDAFVVCLWGLDRYRNLAMRMQQAGGRLMAKHVFHSVSAGRGLASLFLRTYGGEYVIDPARFGQVAGPGSGAGVGSTGPSDWFECESGSCAT